MLGSLCHSVVVFSPLTAGLFLIRFFLMNAPSSLYKNLNPRFSEDYPFHFLRGGAILASLGFPLLWEMRFHDALSPPHFPPSSRLPPIDKNGPGSFSSAGCLPWLPTSRFFRFLITRQAPSPSIADPDSLFFLENLSVSLLRTGCRFCRFFLFFYLLSFFLLLCRSHPVSQAVWS